MGNLSQDDHDAILAKIQGMPPMSPMHAVTHPLQLGSVQNLIAQYRGGWLHWAAVIASWGYRVMGITFGIAILWYIFQELARSAENGTASTIEYGIASAVAGPLGFLIVTLFWYASATNQIHGLTCVLCRVVQKGQDDSVLAVLFIWAYRLPFENKGILDRGVAKPKGAIDPTLNLETTHDVSCLDFTKVYDLKPSKPVSIPESADIYRINKVTPNGDVYIRKTRSRLPKKVNIAQAVVGQIVALAGILIGVMQLI